MSVSKYEPDCTNRCRSSQHGDALTSLLTLRGLSEEEMAAYMRTICSNYCQVVDTSGRTAMHMAASCGHSKIVKWLSQHKECNINAKDLESGFTPLHRSLYCGQIHVAISLIQLGANTSALDNDTLMPIEHVMKDRVCYELFLPVEASVPQCEVYVWGTNANFTLGTGMQHNRQLPELLEPFRKQNITIKQVVMHKFHSVFVSCEGHVYSCGHGHGGRLGLKTEQAVLTPCRVKFPSTHPNAPVESCTSASIGRDHTLLLTDSGNVWTCGLNTHHQLGHSPPPKCLLSPQPLPLRLLKPVGSILGVCAARFHSVVWGPQGILTFGLHAGQLGHARNSEKENTIIKPKMVSALNLKDSQITEVAASDGATVVVTKRGDIFVLHEYQCRKIASRQTDVRKVVVVGGHLDPRLDKENLMDRGGEKLQVLVLTKRGELMLWQEESPQLTRCTFNVNRFIRVRDVAMNRNQVLFVTWDSEAFQGEIRPRKPKKSPAEQSPKASSRPLLEKKDCEVITVTRIPHAHRAISITSDMKGRNFALLQVHPREALAADILPCVQERSTMREQMNNLLLEANEDDAIHDIIFEVGPRIFPAHRLMVVSRSKYLEKVIAEEEAISGQQDVLRVRLDDIEPDVFQNMLKYIYTNQCQLNTPATLQTANTKPVEVFLECSDGKNLDSGVLAPESPESVSAYSVYSTRSKSKKKTKAQFAENNFYNIKTSILSVAKQNWSKYGLPGFHVTDKNLSILEPPSLPKWNRTEHDDLCDVIIRCENNAELRAHKSVLTARLEYFHSMLGRGWRETARGKTTLSLPLPYNILKILVDFLYQDEVFLEGKDSDDLELLTNLLVLADQLFVERLKEMCEMLLTKLVTLRNAAELLQFSETYNAKHLKKFCMEYVTVNMCAVLESRSLEGVGSTILEELSDYYRQWCPSMCFRIITPYSTAPTHEIVKDAYVTNPIIFDSEDSVPLFDCINNKRAIKQAKRKARVGKNNNDDVKTGSRTRKESSSSVGSDDFDQGIKPISFGDLVEKSPPNVAGSTTIPHKENIEKNSLWITISPSSKQNKILQARLKAISAAKESSFLTESLQESFTALTSSSQGTPVGSLPQIVNATPTVMPIKIPSVAVPCEEKVCTSGTPPQAITLLDFPALCSSPTSQGVLHHHKTEKMSPKVVEAKKPVKLSQKQRKRLTSISDIGLMADHLDALNQSPPPPAWGNVSAEVDSISLVNLSLADIMRQELHQTRSSPIAIPKRPVVQVEVAPRKPARAVSNPWAKMESPETSATVLRRDEEQMSFTKIVADEKKSKDNLTKMMSKSLELTQIEDQAISDLLQFYNASKATEERITVERVITGPIAAPTWITNR